MLQGEVGRRRGQALYKSAVECGHLGDQHSHRPGIADDVVQAQEDGVPIAAECQHGDAQKGATGQVERPGGLLSGEALQRAVGERGRKGREIDAGAGEQRSAAISCTGSPARLAKVVRSDSCRSTSSASTAAKTRGSKGPEMRKA